MENLSQIMFFLFGMLGGYFLSNFLPAYFNPRQEMFEVEPANNPFPMEMPLVDGKKPEEKPKPSEQAKTAPGPTGKPRKKTNEELLLAHYKSVPLPLTFYASRIRDTFTPDEVIFSTKGITFNIKTWNKNQESFVLYHDISGVELDEGWFFSTLKIKPKTKNDIIISNFAKTNARIVRSMILEKL